MSVVLAALLGVAVPASAQDGRDATDIWLGVGLGAAADSDGDLSDAAALSLQLSVLTARWAGGVRASFALEASSGGDEISDISLFFGRNWRNRWGHAMLATGVAHTYFGSDNTALGIPFLAEVGLDFFSFLGGGIQAFANVNRTNTIYGATVFVSIGEVR